MQKNQHEEVSSTSSRWITIDGPKSYTPRSNLRPPQSIQRYRFHRPKRYPSSNPSGPRPDQRLWSILPTGIPMYNLHHLSESNDHGRSSTSRPPERRRWCTHGGSSPASPPLPFRLPEYEHRNYLRREKVTANLAVAFLPRIGAPSEAVRRCE
jgi:hypothetical protein